MRILFVFLIFASTLSAQEIRYSKGIVTDSVSFSGSDQTFALFLPSEFDGKRGLPVLFIFDSEGRGRSAAQLFQTAAEKQGYILVSSNNIDPENTLEVNVSGAISLMEEVFRNIPVDYNSISVAGFAEGAKIATSIPMLLEQIHGVIYVGDQHIDLKYLDNKKPFYSIGIVGNRQIELGPMESMSDMLNYTGFPSEVYIFEGGMKWPRPELIFRAVGSLTLQAMRLKKRPVDEVLVDQLYQEDMGQVNKFLSNGKALLAYELLLNLTTKYRGLRSVSEIEEKIKQVERSRNYKDQVDKYEEIMEKENRLWNDFVFYLDEDIANTNFENVGWWNFQKLQLEKLTQSNNEMEVALGYRLIDLVEKLTELKVDSLEESDASLEPMLLANMLATVFDQKDFEAYKNVISLSALDGDFPTALFYLEEMLKNGFTDVDALYDIEGTLGLKLSEDFNWLIKKYLGTARYYKNSMQVN